MVIKADVLNYINEAADADKAPAALKKITDAVNDLFTTNETLTAKVKEQDGTIATLRDTNMRLFLEQTKPIEEKKEEKEQTPEEALKELIGVISDKGGKEGKEDG